MRVSYSQIRLFEQCPFLYKLQYLDGVKFPKSAEAEFGKLLHAVLKYYHQDPRLKPSFGQLIANLGEQWQKSDLPQILADPTAEKSYRREAELILEQYYKKNSRLSVRPLAIEKSFSIKLIDPASGETHYVSGRLDRVDPDGPNGLRVIDYKTSKTLPTQAAIENNQQLAIYHWALAHLWPSLVGQQPVRMTLYFLKHDQKLTASYPRERLDETQNWLVASIQAIEQAKAAGHFPAKDSSLCASGAYRSFCPFYRHATLAQKPKIGRDFDSETVVNRYFELKGKQRELQEELRDLQTLINDYLNQQELEAIWGKAGGITRARSTLYSYDFEKLEPILKKAGQWQAILEPSPKRLKALLEKAPAQLKKTIEQNSKTRQVITFRTKKR